MKNLPKKFLIFSLCISGALVIFGSAYGLIVHDVRLNDHEAVLSKSATFRTAYTQNGPAGIQKTIQAESGYERESTFMEVMGANNSLRFIRFPQGENEVLKAFSDSNQAPNVEWVTVPSGQQGIVWNIHRSSLPDGNVMLVGSLTQSHEDLVVRFRKLFFASEQ